MICLLLEDQSYILHADSLTCHESCCLHTLLPLKKSKKSLLLTASCMPMQLPLN